MRFYLDLRTRRTVSLARDTVALEATANGLDGEVRAHMLFARGCWSEFFAELDENVDLFGCDALNCLLVLFGEVIDIQDACCGQEFNICLFRWHFRLLLI